ncbi:MAG TPA: hypothetical protein PLX20_08825 [Rhodocyclaceae bacterium]|nr:hypothetical protein [Rhodocyclaceae bacterium]HMZ84404.1 hypothetical protein [Rhodocyclaceae bacterium]HNB79815.1 hypothetical protein [Rhodocyclaceae bacterium]HNH13223.1 hypothetical protein [Rhodocyclaceae bacterium]
MVPEFLSACDDRTALRKARRHRLSFLQHAENKRFRCCGMVFAAVLLIRAARLRLSFPRTNQERVIDDQQELAFRQT